MKTYQKNQYQNKKNNENIDEEYFSSESQKISESDVDKATASSDSILDKIKNRNWEPLKEDVKTLLRMLLDYKNGHYKDLPWKTVSAIAFSLLYILNPLDLVPDFIPFLGYLDDITIVNFALKFIGDDIESYRAWAKEQPESTEISID
ncbi:MAG: YkvA family protein [Psychroflexus sp.]